MSLLNFSKANCKNCYKCLRACPVKAIKIKDEQAEIVEDLCIGCGQCLVVCPQDARNIKSDLLEVKEAIKSKKQVIVSIAPSFPGAFHLNQPGQIVTALKSLGFHSVEETAMGAEVISDLYKKYIDQESHKNIITTCCPSTNYLIEHYFPSLIQYMIPIFSPMLAHGKLIKNQYGMDTYVVFIGPCIAKKVEAVNFQHKGTIDGVLTFDELSKWFDEENIDLESLSPQAFDKKSFKRGSGYPIGGGVIKSFLKENETPYEILKVDGIDGCMDVFKSMESGSIEGVCLEVNICRGSCIGGPGMPKEGKDFFKIRKGVKEYVKTRETAEGTPIQLPNHINYTKKFFDRQLNRRISNESEITKILRKIGKYEKEDELNCGGCGYNTCKEKAQAVLEGMAELNMCLPFMRSKAERLTHVIFENTPNIIIVVDEELRVKEFNPTAERVFGIKAQDMKDQPISMLLDPSLFYRAKEKRENILAQKISYPEYGVVLLQSLLYLENQNVVLAIMIDITSEEKQKNELTKVKANAINAAQRVIEKQMRVAQEIASLLGETTAETKVTLTKLKEIAIGETGDKK